MTSTKQKETPYLMAEFIALKIKECGKSQVQIATECGFARASVVSMIKHGRIRVPLDRLAALAKAIDADVFDLYCWWMRDSYGATWAELEKHIARAPVALC